MRWGAAVCTFAAAWLAAELAVADVYWYKDERGITHFTNVPDDPRYQLYLRWRDKSQAARSSRSVKAKSARSTKALEAKRRLYGPVIEEAARSYRLDSALLHAVITAESAYNPDAVSRKGATGLMQLMPTTAERYGVKDLYDPLENVYGGARYLRDLLDLFNHDLSLAVAAYNAGEGAVMQYGNRIPPYTETEQYVSRVLEYYQRYQTIKN
jgi:soluble lytic murein transglycosylase-like protein